MHAVERAAIFADSDLVTIDDFQPQGMAPGTQAAPAAAGDFPEGEAPGAPPSSVREVEEQLIREAMQRFGGNKKRVASELGISRSYLYKRLPGMELE